jgi:hypothetical protein
VPSSLPRRRPVGVSAGVLAQLSLCWAVALLADADPLSACCGCRPIRRRVDTPDERDHVSILWIIIIIVLVLLILGFFGRGRFGR